MADTNYDLKQMQKRILILCVIAYTLSYLCRTNLSLVLDYFTSHLKIDNSAAGLLGTVYFWAYACGQFLGGYLSSRYDAKYVISGGLFLSAFCNFMLGIYHGNYLFILFFWMLNGIGLSLIWPSMVGIVSLWFSKEDYSHVSLLLNLPTTVGYLISWGTLGFARNKFGVGSVFIIPAVLAFCFCIFWNKLMKSSPAKVGLKPVFTGLSSPHTLHKDRQPFIKIVCTMHMFVFAIIVIVLGSTKESINLWAPTLLQSTGGKMNSNFISTALMLIPVFSTLGLLATDFMSRHIKESFDKVLLILLFSGVIFSWNIVFFMDNFWLLLIHMGLLMAILYGSTASLTTLLPLQFADTGYSSLVTAIFNFLAYVGAALGGFLSGRISDTLGWKNVYMMWGITITIIFLALLLYMLRKRRS